MVKNVPFIADDMSLISGQVTKNPHGEILSPCSQNLHTTAGESMYHKEKIPHAATKTRIHGQNK